MLKLLARRNTIVHWNFQSAGVGSELPWKMCRCIGNKAICQHVLTLSVPENIHIPFTLMVFGIPFTL